MKLRIAIITLVLALVACNNIAKQNTAVDAKETAQESEQKYKYWKWIAVGDKESETSIEARFQILKDNGIDAILINTNADPKTLAKAAPVAKKVGLEVHAWMFTTNRPGDSIAQQHPEWYMVSRSGKSCFVKEERPYVGYYQWLSPSHPEARKHILSLIEGLAKVEGVTSVHLDYIRYPDVYLPVGLLPKYGITQEEELPDYDFDYSDASVEKFMKLHHKDPRKMENPAIDIEWKNFRLNEIRSLVNEAYDVVHKHDKKLSAAVFPYPEMADHMVRQRWDKWKIDMVLPMIYYNFYNEELDWIGYATKQGVEDLQGKATQLHTGLFTPKLTPEDLKEAIQLAKDNGAKGIAFFDNGKMTEEQFKVIRESKE